MQRETFFSLAFVVFAAVFSAVVYLDYWKNGHSPFEQTSLAVTSVDDKAYQEGLTPEEKLNIRIYENSSRSVVYIDTQSRVQNFFFQETIAQGAGSGSVLDKQGHILTNFHVIEGATTISVTLFNGNSYEAQLIGGDPANDTAVLKIKAPADELFPITIADSARLKVGQKVYAIGNPFGLDMTLSTGVVSSLNRSLPSRDKNRIIKQVIQIDAAINPGNSGGPLLDSYGEFIGMNTAIASRSGGSDGIGFAIPANTLARIIPQIIRHGHVLRPNHGIEQVTMTKNGLLITRVQPGGPAEKAGLAAPEINRRQRGGFIFQSIDKDSAQFIVGINDKKVENADDLLSVIESFKPGDTVILKIRQGERVRNVPLVLGAEE